MRPNKSLFRPQPNRWSCGPAALRNALLCYGEQHDVRKLLKWVKATKTYGTTEDGLALGAQRAGFALHNVRCGTPEFARESVRAHLRLGQPVILIFDAWEHWVVAFEATSRHLFIADSAKSDPVQKLTWRDALGRMAKWHGPDDIEFDIYPLTRRT